MRTQVLLFAHLDGYVVHMGRTSSVHGIPRVKLAMDPFLGLGSSAIAAAALGVDFIGVEIDAHYLAEAITRVKRALRSNRS